jgi:4-amino-4-deoxy-L-arabinose transferase-like glycosyltransferase
MPDIGLLQGPPRPKLVVVPKPLVEPVVAAAAAPLPPVIELAPEAAAIKIAAHAAVVSERRPMAEVTSELLVDEPLVGEAPVAPVAAVATAPIVAASASSPAESSVPSRDVPGFDPPAAPSAPYSLPPIRLSDMLWLLLALVLIIGTGLGIRDPWPADEPRFASLARDMVASGEWLFPRVGGDLYQDKPPVFFWMLAVCFTLFGSWKGWFLIPAFLAAGGVLFLLYDFGRRTVSREAGLAAAILTLCSLQFVLAMRGAQIDPVLCLLTTFSLYAFLRHLLLGDGWKWYALGGLAAGLGVITKGVGFLPLLLLIPFFVLRAFRWRGLATLDSGAAGWRWWLAPLAMLVAVSLWFVPMLIAAANGPPEYAAYRDEILFKQTVGRYAAAWHHVKAWYYFLVEVIPPLWLPWSLLLFWLVPRFKGAFHERNARIWLPLFWVVMVLLFFSMSPGKRGIYLMPALPALALASLPLLPELLARRGVRIAGWVLALAFWIVGLLALATHVAAEFDLLGASAKDDARDLPVRSMLIAFVVIGAIGMLWARSRATLAAWPAVLAALCISFSYFLAPLMNDERTGKEFVRWALHGVRPGEQLGLVAYKEQFLLYLDRPTVNFGHRRWQEGPQEYFDAAAWLNAGSDRVLLVPEEALVPKNRFDATQPAIPCFKANTKLVGTTSGNDWYLVRAPAETACAALGDPGRAIRYH